MKKTFTKSPSKFSKSPKTFGSKPFPGKTPRPGRSSSYEANHTYKPSRVAEDTGYSADRPSYSEGRGYGSGRSYGSDRSSGRSFGSAGRSFGSDRSDRSEGRSFGSDRPAYTPRSEDSSDRAPRSEGRGYGSGRSYGSDRSSGRSFGSAGRSFGSDRPAYTPRSEDSSDRAPRSEGRRYSSGRSYGSERSSGKSYGPNTRPAYGHDRSYKPAQFGGSKGYSSDSSDDAFDFENVKIPRGDTFDGENSRSFEGRPERRSYSSDRSDRSARPAGRYNDLRGGSERRDPRAFKSSRSFEAPKLERSLSTFQLDKRFNEMIFGAHSLIEVLKAKKRKIVQIYTTKPTPRSWERIQPYMPAYPVQIQYVDVSVLDRMAGTKDHMGIIAWVTPFKFRSKMFDPAKAPFILLLDAVQDVRNLGAILRSASCIGVNGVVLCKAMTAPLTGSAFKASAGLAEHLDIYVAPSLRGAMQEIKEAGYNLYLAVLEKGEDATTVTYKTPSCLVIGNEASGITKDIRSQGTLVTLPQRVADISFNASVAAGILMFTMAHQTKQAVAAAALVAPVVEVSAE